MKKKRKKKKTREAKTEDIKVPKRKVYKTELDMLNEPLTQEAAYVNAFSNHSVSQHSGRATLKTKATASTGLHENASRAAMLTSSNHHTLNRSPVEKREEMRQSTPPPRSAPAPPAAVSTADTKPLGAPYNPGQCVNEVTQIQPTPVHATPRCVHTSPKVDSQPRSLPSSSVPAPFSTPVQPTVPQPPPPPPAAATPASTEEAETGWDQTDFHNAPPPPAHSPVHQPSEIIPRDPPPPPAPAPPPIIPPENITTSLEPVSTSAIKMPPVAVEPRNDLLEAIRQGKKLRTVEPLTVSKTMEFQGMDVASILARRVAFVSESESEEGSDEEEWSD